MVRSLIDILDGKAPLVNTEPVRVSFEPGSRLQYSGGGTTIVQLLIEDLTGEPFDVWMKKNVLDPLGMSDSTFSQSLKPTMDHAAIAHLNTGERVEGNRHIYPEMAAAGLWSTPSDLAKFILSIQSGQNKETRSILEPFLLREMLTRQQAGGEEINSGLGVFLEGEKNSLIFGHDGVDEGFIARMKGCAYQEKGFVAMVNSDVQSLPFLDEITHSIQDNYHWPVPASIKKNKIALNPPDLKRFPGVYSLEESELEITLLKGTLYLNLGLGQWELHPNSKHRFFVQEMDFEIEFDLFSEPAASFKIYQDGKLEGKMERVLSKKRK